MAENKVLEIRGPREKLKEAQDKWNVALKGKCH